MYAYHFNGYWKDVGTIPSLWEANMEVLDPEHSGINLFDEDWKIYSRNSGMPGHKICAGANVENSMITDGCKIAGSVKHSILFAGVKVEAGAVVEDAGVATIGPDVRVGTGAKIGSNAMISEDVKDGEEK